MIRRTILQAAVARGSDLVPRECSELVYGNSNRRSLPSRVKWDSSFSGNRPFHRFHAAGTSRVCATGFSIQPSAFSCRRKTPAACSGAPVTPSNFHPKRLAASASVSDSRGSMQKIHPVEISSGLCRVDPASASALSCTVLSTVLAPYSRATCTVASVESWSMTRISSHG